MDYRETFWKEEKPARKKVLNWKQKPSKDSESAQTISKDVEQEEKPARKKFAIGNESRHV